MSYKSSLFIAYTRLVLSFSGSLLLPNISIDPAGNITWGRDVNIRCSIPPQIHQIVQGYFTLTKNSALFRNDSEAFLIVNVDFENEGLYQCHYHRRASGQNFSFPPSVSVRLSVTGKER